MSLKELELFLSLLKPEYIYFEFGAGGSTYVAAAMNMKKVYSCEGDLLFHNKIKNDGIKVEFLTVDLKTTGNLSYPGKSAAKQDIMNYIQKYEKKMNADVILIDGRFRPACALDLFEKIRNDTVLLIHDYTVRSNYHIVEKYYHKVLCEDTLCVFFKKTEIDHIKKKDFEIYSLKPER